MKALLLFFATAVLLSAETNSFSELFADPATRAEAVATLTPGTRDYYFHTALAHQLAGSDKEYAETIRDWRAAAERKEDPVSSEGLDVLENRRIIAAYDEAPEAALEELKELLGLEFNDSRPDSATENLNLATSLDPSLISVKAFRKAAEAKHEEAEYRGYKRVALNEELEKVADFSEEKIRWFMENFRNYQHPKYTELVKRALALKNSYPANKIRFESLTLVQMDELRAEVASLAGSRSFHFHYLRKLTPAFPTELARHPEEHAAFLEKCAEYVRDLPPSQNSLKSHVLYQHLRLQEKLGNYPKEDFLAYLELPRREHPVIRHTEKSDFYVKDEDYSAITQCQRIGNGAGLVESYLSHFLAAADEVDPDLVPFLQEKPLARLLARARLLAGAESEHFAAVLGAEEYKALREETRIHFAPGTPEVFSSKAAVELPLDLKNTPKLLVRIYEITSEDSSASVDLDGLVPHHSRELEFAQPAMVQHRESIALPELEGAGSWLVEFVAERVSARALIRKGNITPYIVQVAEGQLVRVFDEDSEAVPDFTLTLGSETYIAKDGKLIVPDAANQAVTVGKVKAGKMTAGLKLGSRGDDYALEADFLLDREQLLANAETKLRLRTQLTNHKVAVPLEQVKNPTLILRATLLGGVTTERVIANPLALAETNEIPFLVPADLLSLEAVLSGTVTSAISGEEEILTAKARYALNGALETPRIATALFSPTSDGHKLNLLGRNGEPLPQRPVKLVFTHKDYRENVSVQLRSDEDGVIELGELIDIEMVEVSSPDIVSSRYYPPQRVLSLPENHLVITEDEELRIPADGVGILTHVTEEGDAVALVPLTYSEDESHVVLKSLASGYYVLDQDGSDSIIEVLPARVQDGLLVTEDRIAPVNHPAMPTVAEAGIADESVIVRVAGASEKTSVTVIGKRYAIAGWEAGSAALPFEPEGLPSLIREIRPSSYVTERLLSDEMRYILDRRAAQVFPGSMLPRPGLLLYRWSPDAVDQDRQDGKDAFEGEGLPSMEKRGGPARRSTPKRRGRAGTDSHPTVIDFLERSAVVKFDLKPDAEGRVDLPMAELEGAQFLEIIVADEQASDRVVLPLAASETPLRDRRIARPLAADSHHLATRYAAALAPGAEAEIVNLLDADWRAFTTLEEAYQFLLAATGEAALHEFAFLAKWPELEEKEKLSLLAKHHCHELHLFLSRKDPAFFGKHIRPFLSAKAEPQFMDDYLLARDLEKYLRPYAFSRLNAAEKALLAQALPDRKQDIFRELDLRWKAEAPSPEAETILFTQVLRGADLEMAGSFGDGWGGVSFGDHITGGLRSGNVGMNRKSIDAILNNPRGSADALQGASSITHKLRSIVIPSIDFEDITLQEAVDYLRQQSIEYDNHELDPSKKGIRIVVRAGTGEHRINSLKLRNVPLGVALKYLGDMTKLRYRVSDVAVTMVPQTELGEDLFTRSFKVSPEFMEALMDNHESAGEGDPFAAADDAPRGGLRARPSIADLLKDSGIIMPEGSTAHLSANGTLLITNTPSELDKVEQLTAALGGESGSLSAVPAFPVTPATPVSYFPDHTKLWLGANYYKHRGGTGEELIPLNRFWLELSAWDGKSPFTSPHFNACTRSAADALMCLAMLDLPFSAGRPEVAVEGSSLKIKARAPMLLFYKDTRETENVAEETSLLVRQSCYPLAEPFRTDEQGRKIENTVTGEFRTGVPYGLSLVITNPTGTEHRIETLAQIPAGAIPLKGSPETKSTEHKLEPYGVIQLQLAFYFPAAGDYPAYPLHVSENGKILAHAEPRVMRVSADPAPEDGASWLVVARDGAAEEVLHRLSFENLADVEFDAILWRLKDKEFFLKATEILRKRLVNAPDVFNYGVLHNEPASISDAIAGMSRKVELGSWFRSQLVTVSPQDLGWETMEFDPLVNERAHDFSNYPRLSHDAALEHYEEFLGILKWKSELTSADHLAFTYYLFLQDRIADALERFEKVERAELPNPLQYDYLHALVLFYQEKPQEAQAIAEPYLGSLPPGLWYDRFQNVVSQAEEIARPVVVVAEEKADSRSFLELESHSADQLLFKHANLSSTTLSLYHIDLEVLFSKDPFLKGGVESSLPPIAPNEVVEISFAEDATETRYDLPDDFRQGNILAAAESGQSKQLKILDSKRLEAHVIPAERCIQVVDSESGKVLAKTYVKVFAEGRDGSVFFHKDGYTDLRGKFDYLSSTVEDVADIRRVAILISHPEKGTRTLVVER